MELPHGPGPGVALHRPSKTQLFSVHDRPSSEPRPYKLFEPDALRLANPVAHSGLLPGPRVPATPPGNCDISPSPESRELDCAHTQAHEILWNHFGFLPYDPTLDLETGAYKEPRSPSLRSPLGPRETSYPPHHRRSRTSPPSPAFDISPLPNTMTKKRRSLTSILVPSFLPQASASTSALPTLPTAGRSSISGSSASTSSLSLADTSAEWLSFYSGAPSPLSVARPSTPSRNSPPPDLLDEDPFANLVPSPLRPSRASSPVHDIFGDSALAPLETPLSPLSQSALEQENGTRRARSLRGERPHRSFRPSPSTPPPSPTGPATRPRPVRRPKSSGPPQVRPAYTRPAFAPRPSLPSLNTLASTTPIHVPKVRRGRPGAHLPLEPWEDPGPSSPDPPSPTSARSFIGSQSLGSRRREHIRRPTLSVIRDSRMFCDGDGESAGAGEEPPAEALNGSTSNAADAAEQEDAPEQGASSSTSRSSSQNDLSLELDQESAGSPHSATAHEAHEPDTPPTPPPKSPKSPSPALHRSPSDTSSVSGSSGTSRTSTESTVPSLCPSSPRSCSSASTEPYFHLSPERAQSPLPPLPTEDHIRVHVAADHPGHPGYSDLFAHHRHTQVLTSDLLASLDYNYSDALSQLGNNTSEHASDASLFPPGDFEPGSSAGTIKHVFSQTHAASQRSDVVHSHPRWRSVDGQISVPSMPPLPHSPPELPSSSSEDVSTDNSALSSPILSRSRSSSTVSSEYDFGEDECEYYSYDIGSFQDPLGSPSTAGQQRRFLGYGIPWPSTRRRSSGSAECGGSACSGGGMTDVLDDLEDLAEDVTERFSLARTSPDNSVRSSFLSGLGSGEDDVFGCPGEGGLADAPGGDYSSYSRRPSATGGSSQQHGTARAGSSSNGVSGGYGASWSGRGRGTHRGGAGGGDDDDDDSDDDRRRRPSRLPASSSAMFSDSEEESESDYGSDDENGIQGSPTANKRRQRHDTTRPGMPPTSSPPKDDTTDDDVPLAQQIPGALKAQRTIRRQVRDELDQKRAERRARAQRALLQQQQQQQHEEQQQHPTIPSQQSSPSRPVGRPRTRTLPSNINSPFSAGDLTNKLLSLQTSPPGGTPPSVPPIPSSASPLPGRSKRPSFDGNEQHPSSLARGRTIAGDLGSFAPSAQRSQPAQEGARTLRPTRSFHRRPRTADPETTPPLPAQTPPSAPLSRSGTSLSRSGTTSRRRPAVEEPLPPPPYSANAPALDRGKSTRSAPSRRPSRERQENSGFVVTSRNRAAAAQAQAQATVVVPPPPSASVFAQPAKTSGAQAQMWQQRVFIGNMQRFVLVEIGSVTTAGDVLSIVDGQGALEQGRDGWMLWEVSQDFGMERPIRTFEMLNDVCGAWNSDKTVNLLVIKKTLLAPLLSPRAMPSSSPMCSGYVQWEYKRGKWQKRWMELREHSLWLSKRDTGKDAQFLCSLNNFDAYYVTRVHKAPKPYVFSVKSTDSLTYFEDTADYVHVFSCGESEGKNWLEKILLARSYVLYQERNVVSASSAAAAGSAAPSNSGAGALQRSGTRRRPAQPLVNVGPPKNDMAAPLNFEAPAGSLLARR